MAEMRVGDLGILHSMSISTELNGCVVEVIGSLRLRTVRDYYNRSFSQEITYRVKSYYPIKGGITKFCVPTNKIKPLSDPDAEQHTEQDEELTV